MNTHVLLKMNALSDNDTAHSLFPSVTDGQFSIQAEYSH